MAGGLAVTSWLFLVPLFGADYAEAVPMTLWMLAAMPFVFLQSAMSGKPVIALCGKVWVPGRDPNKFPVCPTCKAIYDGLREPAERRGRLVGAFLGDSY